MVGGRRWRCGEGEAGGLVKGALRSRRQNRRPKADWCVIARIGARVEVETEMETG